MKEPAESHAGRLAYGRRTARKSRRGTARRAPETSAIARRLREATGTNVEQYIRRNASGLTLLGLTLGVFVSRKFLILPVAVTATMLQDVLSDFLARMTRKKR